MLAAATLAFALVTAAQEPPPVPVEEAPALATATTTTTTTTTMAPTTPVPVPVPVAVAAPAAPPVAEQKVKKGIKTEGAEGATFFGGARGAMAFPPAGDGPAPMVGLELGVAAEKGVGYGLHIFGASNTPGAPTLNLPATPYAFGALADIRYYMQTVEPLRLYPTLSLGFMAGPAVDTGKNAVLPLITPGFGARVNLGPIYAAVELGAASFYIPFMALSIGWEPDRA